MGQHSVLAFLLCVCVSVRVHEFCGGVNGTSKLKVSLKWETYISWVGAVSSVFQNVPQLILEDPVLSAAAGIGTFSGPCRR